MLLGPNLHAPHAHARATGAVPHRIVHICQKFRLPRFRPPRPARGILCGIFPEQQLRHLVRGLVRCHHHRGVSRGQHAPHIARAAVYRHRPRAQHVKQLFGDVARRLRVFKAKHVAVVHGQGILFFVLSARCIRAVRVAQAVAIVVHLGRVAAAVHRSGQGPQKALPPRAAIRHKAREEAEHGWGWGWCRVDAKVGIGKVLHVHVGAGVDTHAYFPCVSAHASAVVFHRRLDRERGLAPAAEVGQGGRAGRRAKSWCWGVVAEKCAAGVSHRAVDVGGAVAQALPGEALSHVEEHGVLCAVVRGRRCWSRCGSCCVRG